MTRTVKFTCTLFFLNSIGFGVSVANAQIQGCNILEGPKPQNQYRLFMHNLLQLSEKDTEKQDFTPDIETLLKTRLKDISPADRSVTLELYPCSKSRPTENEIFAEAPALIESNVIAVVWGKAGETQIILNNLVLPYYQETNKSFNEPIKASRKSAAQDLWQHLAQGSSSLFVRTFDSYVALGAGMRAMSMQKWRIAQNFLCTAYAKSANLPSETREYIGKKLLEAANEGKNAATVKLTSGQANSFVNTNDVLATCSGNK